MSWTQADVLAIETAIKALATGASEVRYEGRAMRRESLPELRLLRAEMISEANRTAGGKGHSLANWE